ncbi:hypothetical protein DITRI_Ditri18aG0015700 [Diplodiscus trichospermus]
MDMNQRVAATESSLITLSQSEKKEEKRILLKVQGRNGADQFWYWMGRKTRFQHLMVGYTQRVGVTLNSVRFLCNGSSINPELTADDLNMKDGDMVDVMATAAATQSTLISLSREKDENHILIDVDYRWTSRFFYWMGRSTPLQNPMLDFCDRNPFSYENMRFFYKGKIINPDQTADDLKMQDEDLIHAQIWQSGGN